ncbi:hypothetical protein C8D87_103697 [Lentzea atacamensis]|uniref:Uncharacterized protein n=1 Tax=Lentzea atacamensis TaxID=531938 RepID=A0ABX9EBI9_9PSEU|nr:hypothetical protein C8D87_103697 [Lentzea atacamensis]
MCLSPVPPTSSAAWPGRVLPASCVHRVARPRLIPSQQVARSKRLAESCCGTEPHSVVGRRCSCTSPVGKQFQDKVSGHRRQVDRSAGEEKFQAVVGDDHVFGGQLRDPRREQNEESGHAVGDRGRVVVQIIRDAVRARGLDLAPRHAAVQPITGWLQLRGQAALHALNACAPRRTKSPRRNPGLSRRTAVAGNARTPTPHARIPAAVSSFCRVFAE